MTFTAKRIKKVMEEIRYQQALIVDAVDDLVDYSFTRAMTLKKDVTRTYEERLTHAQVWEALGDVLLDIRNDLEGEK